MRVTSAAALLILAASLRPSAAPDVVGRVDHVIYATPDLQAGIDAIEKQLGVRATPGGSHPGRGTRNALVALGPATYIEIIGPDPAQPAPPGGRPFRIDAIESPTLVTWAMKSEHLEQLAAEAKRHEVVLGPVIPGSRARPDGVVLTWRYTDPHTVIADGIVPFLIDWGTTSHPAATAAKGATLVGLRAEHPDAARVQKMLQALGLFLPVAQGSRPALIATIDSPNGRVEIR